MALYNYDSFVMLGHRLKKLLLLSAVWELNDEA